MTAKKSDPIKKITLADGRTRYRFVVDVGKKPDGKRDQKTYTYDTLKQARAERARIVADVHAGTHVKRDRSITVADYLAEWLDSRTDGLKPSTARFYADALRPVTAAYGSVALQSLDVPHLTTLKRHMLSGAARRRGTAGKPLSARAVNATLGALSTALKAAVKRGLIARNVAELVDRVTDERDNSARGEWQSADAVAFLRSVRGDRLYAAWLLSMFGLRRGEVLGLRWADVDLSGERARERKLPEGTPSIDIVNNRVMVAGAGTVEGSPKGTGRKRAPFLPVPAVVVDALRAVRDWQALDAIEAGDGYTPTCDLCGGVHVVADELGRPYSPESYSDMFEVRARRAGLPAVPLHGTRHCAASLLADAGVPDVAVAAWLGHTQVTVTHGYQHVMAQRLADAGRTLGDLLAG